MPFYAYPWQSCSSAHSCWFFENQNWKEKKATASHQFSVEEKWSASCKSSSSRYCRMDALVKALFKWPIVQRLRAANNDDEHVDRLNHRVTVGLILAAAFLTTSKGLVDNRISCWIPAELKHPSYPKYVESYCWISNTYYVHTNADPPATNEERREAQIGQWNIFVFVQSFLHCTFEGYYQWVSILLLLMALCFYLPRLFWRSFNTHCGIDIQSLITNSQKSSADATKILEYYCQSLKSTPTNNPSMRLQINYRRNKHRGNYLFTVYLLSRVMYLLNSILQLFLLNILLGHRGNAWMLDIDIIRSIFRYGNPLLDSPYFPRVALCDVFIREISDIHRYTVQCALPFNILNEKIFLGLSFWFSYVVLHNLCSFVILIYQQLGSQRIAYVRRLTTMVRSNGDPKMEHFCWNYLTFDGLFLLRLISHNSSELRTVEVLQTMFTNYQGRASTWTSSSTFFCSLFEWERCFDTLDEQSLWYSARGNA